MKNRNTCVTASLRPKVSVLILTYNHVQFIRKCIESVLAQITTFDYEIVIGEDGSSDGTFEVCSTFRNRYPRVIKLANHSRKNVIKICGRVTGRANLINTWSLCRGEYVALLDGDDFWIDDFKLQKQVDFLEKNKDFNLCATNVEFRTRDLGFIRLKYPKGKTRVLTLFNFIDERTILATASAVIRRASISNFPSWYYSSFSGDWGLFTITCLNGGKGALLPFITAVYRVHGGGLNTSADSCWRLKLFQKSYWEIIPVLNGRARMLAIRKYSGYSARLALRHLVSGRHTDAVTALRGCFHWPMGIIYSVLEVLRVIIKRSRDVS